MRSTFFGLETAKRGMFTQQLALDTTGHNVTNASTPGYSRQRVNFATTDPFPAVGLNRPIIPGQLGTGVKAENVQRIRDEYIDAQQRFENGNLTYWSGRYDTISRIEDIVTEPSDSGFAITRDKFWQSLQDLASGASDDSRRAVVRERGKALAETFNFMAKSLTKLKGDSQNELNISIKEINSVLLQINNINRQVASVEVNGMLPNDLYDERDRLVDQLSNLAHVRVTPITNGTLVSQGGTTLDVAEGNYTIDLIDDKGVKIANLLDGSNFEFQTVSVEYNAPNTAVSSFKLTSADGLTTTTLTVPNLQSTGKLTSLAHSFGYVDGGGNVVGAYPDLLKQLDQMAFAFVKRFNTVHQGGITSTKAPGGLFFDDITAVEGAASKVVVSNNILSSLANIAATEAGKEVGNGTNALLLSNIKDEMMTIGTSTTTLKNFFEGVIGDIGVKGEEAMRMAKNSQVLSDSISQRREAVRGVSIDDEMTNLVMFQHAYTASARVLTAVDEMLDKVINSMGLVGR